MKQGLIKKWLWLGLDKETAERYQRRIAVDNIRIIKNESLVITILCSAYAMLFLNISNWESRGIICFIGVSVMLAVYLYARYLMTRQKEIKKSETWLCMGAFICCAYITTIYLGTFAGGNELAVTAVGLFIFMPTNFDILPRYSIRITLVAALSFALCSYLTKTPNKFLLDVMDAGIAIVIGTFVSWEKAKIKWESVMVHDRLEEERDIDILTGIWNRRAFEREVGRLVENGELESMLVAMLDLDKFKRINDSYGHEAGDEYLRHFCEFFKDFMGENAVLGRRSGDEFFMFLYNFEEPSKLEDSIKEFYRKLEAHPMEMPDETEKVIQVSTGAVWTKNMENDWKSLLYAADEALYFIKENGRNSYVIEEYNEEKYH